MVKEYLENLKNDLEEKKEKWEKKYNDLQIKLKENINLIIYLEKGSQDIDDLFAPRDLPTKYDKKKIEDLKREQEELQEGIEDAAFKLNSINGKLAELTSIMEVARQNEKWNKSMTDVIKNNDFIRLKFLETQELERQRIARDLHDSTIQRLTGLGYKMELCTRLVDMDQNKCKQELYFSIETLHQIIDEMRKLIYDLRPMSYDDIGLDVTMEREISKLEQCGIEVHYKLKGNLSEIKPVITLTVLRVVQEACNNILKHAEAKNVNISIVKKDRELRVTIEDDGKGFDMEVIHKMEMAKEDYSGFGLSIMHERVFLLSGQIDIYSELNKGTKILVKIPLET